MSYIGILEYVIGVIHDKDIYVGKIDSEGKKLKPKDQYSSFFVDAKRYDDEDILREELESLPKTLTYKILEIQRCPKCKKEFTEYPALSREDNETENCPECGGSRGHGSLSIPEEISIAIGDHSKKVV